MRLKSRHLPVTLLLLALASGCTALPLSLDTLPGFNATSIKRSVSRRVTASNLKTGSPSPQPTKTPTQEPEGTPTPEPKATPDEPATPSATPTATPTPDLVATDGSPLPLQVSTFAGGTQGEQDGMGTAAQFNSPNGIAMDKDGLIYIADAANHRIRVIKPWGEVTTLAGSTKGFENATALEAKFNSPYGVAVDGELNVYVADTYNHSIRKISPEGVVETLAGSGTAGFKDATGTAAQFNLPFSLAVDDLQNVYVADAGNHRIRKISPLGVVTTVAGTGAVGRVDGPALEARFSIPNDVALDAEKNLYVADFGNHAIRKISFGGDVSTLAGNGVAGAQDGAGSTGQFNSPTGLDVDASGTVYVADNANNRIRRVSTEGQVMTLAGTGFSGSEDGGALSAARFSGPTDVFVGGDRSVYVTDTNNNRIRLIK